MLMKILIPNRRWRIASASAWRLGSVNLYNAQKINRIVLLVSNIIGRVCTALNK
jgi:hypothetical protein